MYNISTALDTTTPITTTQVKSSQGNILYYSKIFTRKSIDLD